MTTACDFYILNGPIEKQMESGVRALRPEATECAIFLTTYGGSGDSAYRMMRLLQQKYRKVRIAVAGMCKSAGTIMAIGADELYMGEAGELGPLDVQVYDGVKSSRNSGLDFNAALTIARNEVVNSFATTFQMMTSAKVSRMHAIEAAGRIAQSVASALYTQIDPVTIGAMQRSIAIALEYGTRLSRRANTISDENLKRLIAGYPAHSFCIDREEASGLFNSVHKLEESQDLLLVLQHNSGMIAEPISDKCIVCKVDRNESGAKKEGVKQGPQLEAGGEDTKRTRKPSDKSGKGISPSAVA